MIVPVGGGGLISGVAIALKSARPEVRVIGRPGRELRAVRRRRWRRAESVAVDSALTIADGIAVKRPGELTLPLIERWVDELVVVDEDDVAEAMVFLLERAKLVVEGAGAVGVAALLSGRVRAGGRAARSRWCCPAATSTPGCWRRSCAVTRARSAGGWCCWRGCPTGRARWRGCCRWWPSSGANLLDVIHIREGFDLHVRETAVQLVLETRGQAHAEQVTTRSAAATASRALR